MKLLPVQPSQLIGGERVFKAQRLMSPRLSLPVLASLTPASILVRISDEHPQKIPFKNAAELVGISFMTLQVSRTNQTGDEFRRRGRSEGMGGNPALRPSKRGA